MSKFRLSLKSLFQVLFRPLIKFIKRLQGRGNPHQQLEKICDKLQQQISTSENGDKVWQLYNQALTLARKCDRSKLTQVINTFDPLISKQNPQAGLAVGQALSFLLEATPQTAENLDAAWRLSHRLEEITAIQDVQQQIGLQTARMGDGNRLLTQLFNRRGEASLSTKDLSEVLQTFLERHSFQLTDSWKAFFEQLPPHEIPVIHQVYAVLERFAEAADLAEKAKDYRSTIRYLMSLSGHETAHRILNLANRLGDETAITKAHQKVAECDWQDGDYASALEHFQAAGNRERASDCYQKLGELKLAIQCRPAIKSEWIRDIRNALENQVRPLMAQQEFLSAICLLKSVEDGWREKQQINEADRTHNLLSEAVRTARSAFNAELETHEEKASPELFKRWSQLEEAAGYYLEAGIYAEKAQDHFTAALLFEKAGAFGQALVALDSAPSDTADSKKKAQLLEQGGDFFMAAMLYERLGEIDQAIALYEQAGEFWRAAQLRQQQLGNEYILFDDRFLNLLIKAGRVEDLAELYAAQASTTEQHSEQRARLWRRIKTLADQGFIGQKWLDRAATELPNIEALERRRFDDRAKAWVRAASQEVLSQYIDAIGLDLGTSNSVVCLYHKQNREAEVVEPRRRRQIPSVFAIDQAGRELVGVPIAELLSKSPRAIITKAKREMGTNRKFRVGGQDYRAEEIAARIIRYAHQVAQDHLQNKIAEAVSTLATRQMGEAPPTDWINELLKQDPPVIPLNNIVITVPAYFNEAQKQATKTAGMLADINLLRLIHEPTAACLAQRLREDNIETILVADLGAGTFDLSIIEAGEGVFEVHEIEGDNALGSADLDEILYTHFSDVVKAETGQELPRNSQAATRLRQACEELKIELSSQSEWTIDLPYLVDNHTLQLALTRDKLEHLASPWLKRIRETCEKVKHKPDRILLVGGGGLMPAVRHSIQDVFHLMPNFAYDPLTVVARGAAFQAAILLKDIQETVLIDVVPFSLGIKCQLESGDFKFDRVIPKHTTIPTDKTRRYTTIEDNQTSVRIEIFQGESTVPTENFKIGEFILQDILMAEAGVPQIDVTFDIDPNCLLTVTARDASTGNEQSITIADSHLLTPAQTKSLHTRFQDSQRLQEKLATLETLTQTLQDILSTVETADLVGLSQRCQNRIQAYESHRERYSPTSTDNDTLFEIYRDRSQVADKIRLALDQWATLTRSIHRWLDRYRSTDWRASEIETQVQQLFDEGDRLRQRAQDARVDVTELATQYQKWLSVLDNLPINLDGSPEELAQHFLNIQRYAEAQTQFQRLSPPFNSSQIELGLEILARVRQREAYTELLCQHADTLGVHNPDFDNLNLAVRNFATSMVWIQVATGGWSASGSGFAIDSHLIATNKHVLMNDVTGNCVAPQDIRVVTHAGVTKILSIHVPSWGDDDVALLRLKSESCSLNPLRLGFSELVEVGESIMTVGFPAPERGGFEENLYCNTGLVNRVRPSPRCSERVLEVSIPLQGGISGAPILNRLGEVIGVLTFYIERNREGISGRPRSEQSFYAIPVELLHRLRNEINPASS